MKKTVYLDYAATTPVRDEVLAYMTPFFTEHFGNPASNYNLSNSSRDVLKSARASVAEMINAEPSEIYFTGGGTEADNMAVFGIANAYAGKGGHIITTAFEHHAVLHACKYLEKKGHKIDYIKPDSNGFINPGDIERAIRPDTVLISVIFANNEIGSVQPIEKIGQIASEKGVIFHTDAVQAAGHLPVDVKKMNIDMLSMSAHKLYGPKGTGALFIRKGVRITPIIHGGAQEFGRRAGTHNTPGIAGFGKAAELACSEMKDENKRITVLRDKLLNGIVESIPYVRVNGGMDNRLAGNLNLSFKFVESESILDHLSLESIYASSGSACNSDSLEPSHVLMSLGMTHAEANGSVRFSLGRYTSDADIDYVIKALPPIIAKLRNMSPLYEDFVKNQNSRG